MTNKFFINKMNEYEDNEYSSNELGLSKDKEYQQFEPKKEATSLQNNIEEPIKKDIKELLEKEKEETLKNDIENTNPYSIPLKNENEIEILIDNKTMEAIQALNEVKANLESLGKNDNNIENTEEVINEDNFDSINKVNRKKNISKKDKLKSESSETDKTEKQKVPETKNLIKSVELFMNSYRCYFNYRCKRYGLKKFQKIDFEKLYGNRYKRHKRFLKRSMKDAFGFRNRHNKTIIHNMIHKEKDEIFITFMKLKVEDAYNLYKNNYPYLHMGKSRRFLSHFISLKQAINDKKEKELKRKEKKEDEKALEDLDILKEEAENFIDSINEERRNRKTLKIKIKRKTKKKYILNIID